MSNATEHKIVQMPLTESDALDDPLQQFNRWFDEATDAGLPLPNAMTLATVSADSKPSARLVLLKEVDEAGFVFYTNYESRKASDLGAQPFAALVFHWNQFERQVRVEGRIEKVSASESDAYFATRPLGSRLSAVASPQSQVVPSRAWLEARVKSLADSHEREVPRPAHWGGYRLLPHMIEFWQGRADRLHDRLLYRKAQGGGWTIERLAP